MRLLFVALPAPAAGDYPGFGHAVKPLQVQTFILELVVKAFAVNVLPGTAGIVVLGFHPTLPENNSQDRILSTEERGRLLDQLPRHAFLVLHFAYLTGMKAGKVFNLTWNKVDFKQRLIKLEAEDTKTSEPRVIFLNDELLGILNEAGKVRGLGHNRVFTYAGRPIFLYSLPKVFSSLTLSPQRGISANLR